MGWTSCREWKTIKDIERAIKAENPRLRGWRRVGLHLWALQDLRDPHSETGAIAATAVVLFLLERGGGCYAYKSMDETMHPYYYDCPLDLLKQASEPPLSERSGIWRNLVRAHHAEVSA